MAMQKTIYHVELEDGSEFDVAIDQRDVSAFELAGIGSMIDNQVTFVRFCAFSAARRAGNVAKAMDFITFNELCTGVSYNAAKTEAAPKSGRKAPTGGS